MQKIEALLAEKGRVEGTDMPWAYAVGILKRQTRGEITSFQSPDLTDEALNGVIAALSRDADRKGRYHEVYGRSVDEEREDSAPETSERSLQRKPKRAALQNG